MREIKFRGLLRSEDINWVYGYYVVDPNGLHKIYYQPFDSATSNTYHIVKPETVGQYTGLKDKNGVEIYEGDIIAFQRFANYEYAGFEMHFATVIFKDGCFMWDIFKFGTNSSFHRSDKNEPLKRTCATWGLEVIGNVHQSPELL